MIFKNIFINLRFRKFKRIRQEIVDSDSDESEHPSKRKFLRDDLSVEFVDTETSVANHLESALDSQKMNYDVSHLQGVP